MKNLLPILSLIACNDFEHLPQKSKEEIKGLEEEFRYKASSSSEMDIPESAPDSCQPGYDYAFFMVNALAQNCDSIAAKINEKVNEYGEIIKYPYEVDRLAIHRELYPYPGAKVESRDISKVLLDFNCSLTEAMIMHAKKRAVHESSDFQYIMEKKDCRDSLVESIQSDLSAIAEKRREIVESHCCLDKSKWDWQPPGNLDTEGLVSIHTSIRCDY